MAKKRKKGEKAETYDWVPPEFNEEEFLKKDLRSSKSLMITAALAILFGILSFSIVALLGDAQLAAILVIFGGAAALKKLYPFLGIKESDVDKKMLAGNIARFVLLSLGIWILLMNKPFFA